MTSNLALGPAMSVQLLPARVVNSHPALGFPREQVQVLPAGVVNLNLALGPGQTVQVLSSGW